MNHRARDLIYGRRGGGWVDDTPTRPATTTPRGDPTDRACRICGLPVHAHTGDLCPICRRPIEHHQPGDEALEWAAAARVAALNAGTPAATPLNDLDREALRRAGIPDPTLDTAPGMRDGATP